METWQYYSQCIQHCWLYNNCRSRRLISLTVIAVFAVCLMCCHYDNHLYSNCDCYIISYGHCAHVALATVSVAQLQQWSPYLYLTITVIVICSSDVTMAAVSMTTWCHWCDLVAMASVDVQLNVCDSFLESKMLVCFAAEWGTVLGGGYIGLIQILQPK